jgi:dTDP-4-amino-4,6-dideoxygalactose transaminase
LYGLAQDMRDLLAICQAHGIYVIEDAAQAFGATLEGRMVGTWGDAGLYSLGRGKCIPAGHGGAIVSQERCASSISGVVQQLLAEGTSCGLGSVALFAGYALATRPMGWWFLVRTPLNPATDGLDMRDLPPIDVRGLSAAQAGLGTSILSRLDLIQSTCRRNAQWLMDELAQFRFVSLPHVSPHAGPVFLRLPIVVDRAERASRLYDRLWEDGIGVSRSYRHTMPEMCPGVFTTSGDHYPGASQLAACLLTLPTHAYLDQDDVVRIIGAFHDIDT